MKAPAFVVKVPNRIRFFGHPVTVEGGVLVGKWTDELPEDMVPEAERIYVPEGRALRAERQRDMLLELAKAARNVLRPAPDDPMCAHPLLVKLDAAIAECEAHGREPHVEVRPPSPESSYSKVPLQTCENCGFEARILYGSQWKCGCGHVNPVK